MTSVFIARRLLLKAHFPRLPKARSKPTPRPGATAESSLHSAHACPVEERHRTNPSQPPSETVWRARLAARSFALCLATRFLQSGFEMASVDRIELYYVAIPLAAERPGFCSFYFSSVPFLG